MLFWIIIVMLTAFAVGLLLIGLTRSDDTPAQDRGDIAIYRDQLAEVDRDLARGVLNETEAERTRTEVARRILAADKTAAAPQSDGPKKALKSVLPLALVLGAGGLYAALGGYSPDFRPQDNLPRAARLAQAEERFANRPSQSEAEAAWAAANPPPKVDLTEQEQSLVTRLREVVAQKPDELQGWKFLVDVELDLGDSIAAARAQSEVLRIKGADAELADLERLVDLMVGSTGGEITPEAEAVIREILRRDPENGLGLYYAGLMRAIYGRPDLAFPIWKHVLETSPPDAPWVAPIRQNIVDMAWFAGKPDYELPGPMMPGPTAQDMANASDMSAEDQQAMIRGMVDQLGERLATEGGSPEEWARMLTALGVLGDVDRAKAIWAEAQTVFAGNDAALTVIRAAAQQTGVSE